MKQEMSCPHSEKMNSDAKKALVVFRTQNTATYISVHPQNE
jgi:hypothetical protein